ncbi:MAG: MltA domain-containing protein [Rhizomicrobium sp.]|jgi:membrane-bound lytic murein transglycosylase A
MSKGSQRSPALPLLILILIVVGGIAVWVWREKFVVPSARLELTPVSFASLPGWAGTDARGALAAFRRTCTSWANEPPTHALGGAGYAGAVADWDGVCANLPGGTVSEEAARRYFESGFTPVMVGSGSDGLFTGYYEPEIHASRRKHGAYAVPIYGVPDDLITADLGLFRDDLKGDHVTGRVVGHTFVPYFNRADIDAHGLPHAPVLLYANDPVQVFFLHIQGSGRMRFEDGSFERLAYAGQNGRPYTPVGRTLISEGAIDRSQMSMQAIRSWMQTHTDAARNVMETDQSFVFFHTAPIGDPSLGSPGSEGLPLTPEASIAVDTRLHALGAPFYVAATAPDSDPAKPERTLDRVFIAQDTGGAIKGAARADVFWGFGRDAESVAGRMKSTGSFYVLLPKPVAARISPHTNYGAP